MQHARVKSCVAAVFAASNASNAVNATQSLVQRFVARRNLRTAKDTVPKDRPQQSAFVGQILEKGEQSSLTYIRWNQLHAALTEAHRKHSVFADSKKRALRVGQDALKAAEGYIHCQGQDRASQNRDVKRPLISRPYAMGVSDVADLQLQWQRAIRLQDEDIAASAAIASPGGSCPSFEALIQVAHHHGVQAMDAALSNVLTQVLSLEAITTYQKKDREIRGVTTTSNAVPGTMLALHQLAADATGGNTALFVAARALDVVGPSLCPAPGRCDSRATVLKMNTTGEGKEGRGGEGSEGEGREGRREGREVTGIGEKFIFAALKPGQLLLEKRPISALQICESSEVSKLVEPSLLEKPSKEKEKEKEMDVKTLQTKLFEKLEQMEEEMMEMRDIKQKELKSVSLLAGSSDRSASFLHSLCGGDCAQSFQKKLTAKASFLQEFTGWWMSQHRK
eukprot:Skav204844  [mRNA]  locus=scaffold1883:39376:43985:- [translate_table: standard]